ncbi:MAG TPA: hypothetical protein VHB21_22895 [Minicystis sp.]|nr:hypothetical protein [Minicystis sp.]
MASSRFTTSLLVTCMAVAAAVGLASACGGSGDTGSSGFTTSSGSHGSGSGSGGSGGGLVLPDGGQHAVTVEPASATITITAKNGPKTQAFSAFVDGHKVDGAAWSLDSYDAGTISTAGVFTTSGIVGGKITVTAKVGTSTASATLAVKVKLSEDVSQGPGDPGVSPGNKAALMGPPMADPGPNPTKILYPYDQTVMPRGLVAPLLQFSPGNVPPEDAKVSVSSADFSWDGFIHVQNGGVPQFYMPQDVWDAALLTTGGQTLTISVTKAAMNVAYGPAKTHVVVAPAALTGAVYYMTYQTPNNGLYSVLPGAQQPAALLKPGCLVCHAVSANGTRLALGTDDANLTAESGIYDVGSDGTATQITQSPPGLGGDSRGISYATFTPDGKYVMRSQNNFWGGVNQQAWFIDAQNGALVPATVNGLGANVSAYLPAVSSDGKHYAFTNGPEESPPFATPQRSISLMDLSIDDASKTLTFSNRKVLLDNGASGSITKFVNFLPDSNYLVLQEGENYCSGYGMMLPSWDASCAEYSFGGATGRLYLVNAKTGEHLELAKLDQGNVDTDRQRNYEPFPLPVTAGGYFWVVFTSIREYGNVYQGGNVRKQLWVAAITPNAGAGVDPSHPPFYLPNQTDTPNERGYWALEPCKAVGKSCETGDQCCDGFCRPSDPNDPSSPKTCKPPGGGCSQSSETCQATSDCCGASSGTQCIGGFCTPPVPH